MPSCCSEEASTVGGSDEIGVVGYGGLLTACERGAGTRSAVGFRSTISTYVILMQLQMIESVFLQRYGAARIGDL